MPLNARPIGISALWNPGTYLSATNVYNPVYKGNLEKLYIIRLTTLSGCVTVDTLKVRVFKEINMYVPTAFTPNGDGVNDFIKPIAAGFKEITFFRIYNRFGQLMYSLKNNELGWNGIYKGLPQPTQTFVWMAEGISVIGDKVRKKGTVILIR